MAEFLSMAAEVMDEDDAEFSIKELKERNYRFYKDILPENYENSYGNPAYAVKKAGRLRKSIQFSVCGAYGSNGIFP